MTCGLLRAYFIFIYYLEILLVCAEAYASKCPATFRKITQAPDWIYLTLVRKLIFPLGSEVYFIHFCSCPRGYCHFQLQTVTWTWWDCEWRICFGCMLMCRGIYYAVSLHLVSFYSFLLSLDPNVHTQIELFPMDTLKPFGSFRKLRIPSVKWIYHQAFVVCWICNGEHFINLCAILVYNIMSPRLGIVLYLYPHPSPLTVFTTLHRHIF